jgi:branched-subunit amino acid ABC-type transport system permease component
VAFLREVTALLPFLLMMGVLIWRPTGLAGSRV